MPYRKKVSWFRVLYIKLNKLPWKGIFFVLFSVFLLVFAIQSWLDGYASLNWKITSGKITTSKAITCHTKYSFPNSHKAVIVYSYIVSGVSYSASQISFTADQTPSLGCGNAEEMMKRYPLGSSVSVYYNPQNPEDSVLIPGGTNFLILGFSLLLGYLGVVELTSKEITRTKIVKQIR